MLPTPRAGACSANAGQRRVGSDVPDPDHLLLPDGVQARSLAHALLQASTLLGRSLVQARGSTFFRPMT
jgi:hypothetical protein